MGSNTSKLHSAVLESNVRVLKKLVEKRGVDIETEFPAQNCATSERYKDKLVIVRAIHVAARHGYVQELNHFKFEHKSRLLTFAGMTLRWSFC